MLLEDKILETGNEMVDDLEARVEELENEVSTIKSELRFAATAFIIIVVIYYIWGR